MPEGAVYVGRPSRWGNPYRVGFLTPAGAVFLYRTVVARDFDRLGWLEPLRGRDLACWCPLDQPCHADVLLELTIL